MNSVIADVMRRYGFAVFSTMLATWARVELNPVLGDRVPFGLYFLSVLLTAWIAGTGPAILALAGGIVAAAHWIIPPPTTWLVPNPADQFSLAIYGIVTAVGVALMHRLSVESAVIQQRACENEQLSHKLSDADRRKDEFLALLAHELRNPLAPIRTGLEVLERDTEATSTAREVQCAIRRQVDQLVRIVDDLLDVSRFLRGHLRMHMELIDLRDVVDLSLHTVEPLVQENLHDLQFLRPQHPVVVRGDEVRLTQVVANLLTNAVRYTPRHGRIRVILDRVGDEARLQVVDNGIGIPLEAQHRIFDLFSQANPSHTRDHGGLGLGLAIVRHIVDLHAGTVAVASDGPGRGCRFTVTLKAVPQPAHAAPKLLSLDPSHASGREEAEASGKRVMIVDDNQDAATTLSTLLSYDGFCTEVAGDGPSALKTFGRFEPDVILLDIGMPGMDGYEVARRLREVAGDHRATIIAVTGWGQDSDRTLSREAGIDHHLVKPVDIPRLLDLISAAPHAVRPV